MKKQPLFLGSIISKKSRLEALAVYMNARDRGKWRKLQRQLDYEENDNLSAVMAQGMLK